MIATNNSDACGPPNGRRTAEPQCRRRVHWLPLLSLLVTLDPSIHAETDTVLPGSGFALRAYTDARERFRRDTNDVEAACHYARTCFDWGDFSTNDDQRGQIANEGIAISRQVIARNPELAAGHYYLAYNLGQLARTKLLGALALVREMERELKSARDLDENFDFGGPDRTLGQLYFSAPGWPTSIGDKVKARKHLEHAVQLNGRYPDNRILLMETLLDAHQREAVQREAKAFAASLSDARLEFTGERWAASWSDWERRWKVIQDKLEKLK